MILHKFNTSPFSNSTIIDGLKRVSPIDGVVLTEDAVYTIKHSDLLESIQRLTKQIYVLEPDLHARGLVMENAGIKTLDYPDLVALTLEYDSVVSW